MGISQTTELAENRFGWIYGAGARAEPSAPYDTVIAECPNAIVIPSKGSLVPGWVLTLPRRPVLNLAQLAKAERADLLNFSDTLTTKLLEFAGNVAQFEHGASYRGSLMGCGVDLAHLHTVPLSFDLLDETIAQTANLVSWRAAGNFNDPWVDTANDEYIIMRDCIQKRAIVGVPKRPQSQLIRRIIAKAIGCKSEWNYRNFPFLENVNATLQAFEPK